MDGKTKYSFPWARLEVILLKMMIDYYFLMLFKLFI